MKLPKMQDPYLSSKEVNLVFNLPARGGLSERVEDNETEIVCVITQLYALLKNPDGAHPAVRGARGALMAHNYALIREARDIVLPGWGEGRED